MPRKAPKSKRVIKRKKMPKPAKKEAKKEVGVTSAPTKKKPTHSYSTYIGRLKGSFGEKVRLSSNMTQHLDRLTQVLAQELSDNARTMCIANKKKTVTEAEVCLAVSLHFPEGLREGTLAAIQTAIETSAKALEMEHHAPVRREVLANLIFAVSLTEKFLRNFEASKLNVGKNAPVALTAALEHIVHQILDISVKLAQDSKKATVNPRHMFLAISNDEGLSALTKTFSIEFMGVGVIPFVHPKLRSNKAKKAAHAARRRKSRVPEGNKKKHKFLPGTVALRQIDRYQKSTETLLQKLPFERMVRNNAQELSSDLAKQINREDVSIHFGHGTLHTIQCFVEQKVTELLRTSVDLAVHAKREGIKLNDVEMAWKLTYTWVPQTTTEAPLDSAEDEEDQRPKNVNGMVRLGRRGGAKRIGKEVFPVIRQFIHSLVTIILVRTIEILKYRKVITVGLADLETSFSALGINFALLRPTGKHRTSKKVADGEE